MATRTISMAGGNWNSAASWDEGATPTSADDVVAGAMSGNLTINVNAACRSIDLTNYTGTLTHNDLRTLTIGTSTANASAVALKFVSGMTYTRATDNTFIAFSSSSTTQQTITSAGKNLGYIEFSGGGSGSWVLTDNLALGTGATYVSLVLTSGTFDAGGFTVSLASLSGSGGGVRGLVLGSGTWTVSGASGTPWDMDTVTNLTFSGASATIVLSDTGASAKTFAGGGKTFGTVSITTGGAGAWTFTGSNTFTKLTTSGGSTKTVKFTAGTTQTLTGGTDAFFTGAVSNLITCESTSAGAAWNLSKSSGIVSSNYLSLKDSAAAGGATFYAGSGSTNVSGNSGWSFTDVPTSTGRSVAVVVC